MSWRRRRRACPTCGTIVEDGIFCRMCGSRLDDPAGTDGLGASRVLRSVRSLLPGLTAAAFIGFVVLLFVTGAWIIGALALAGAAVAAAAILLLQAKAEEPRSPVSEVRDRARFALAFVQIRSTARRQVVAIDAELHGLQARRQERVVALGEATYRGDEDASGQAREELRELDEQIEQQHETRRRVVEEANAHIERERGFVEPTQVVPPDAEAESAEPAQREPA